MHKFKLHWTAIIGLLAVLALLLLLDFRIVTGKYNSEHMLSSMAFGNEGNPTISRSQQLDLYVTGQGFFNQALAKILARSLAETLAQNSHIQTVNICQGTPQKAADSVMLVEIQEANLFWAIFYGSGQVKVEASYATNGDVDWVDEETFVSKPGDFTKWAQGTFTTRGSTFGLMSLPGFYHDISQQVSRQINNAVEDTLKEDTR